MENAKVFRVLYGLVLVSLIYLMATSCAEKENPESIFEHKVRQLEVKINSLQEEIVERDSIIYELLDEPIVDSSNSDAETYLYE